MEPSATNGLPAGLADWAERPRLTPTPVRAREISEAEVVGMRRLRDALFRVVIAHTRGDPHPPGELTSGIGHRASDVGHRMSDVEHQPPVAGLRPPGTTRRCPVPSVRGIAALR
ncbi:ABATE domain-containing protein [Streptomyces sp. NPDC057654]|uniref:ABATE domain-containing protein n=1 Tax=Streptomyces sp. NPDC057654 TaxID=3346196 RepID=UPI0036CA66DC